MIETGSGLFGTTDLARSSTTSQRPLAALPEP